MALLCEAPRGQTDLEKFARGLSPAQRRALGIRSNLQGDYPAPSQSTFSRFLAGIDASQLNQTLLAIQRQLRGPAPKNQWVVMDGKEPRHGSGASLLTAVTVPSQHYLGSAVVDQKTNEIPVAQKQLIPPLDLEGRFVSLDALHTQDETARRIVLEAGGDDLLTVKKTSPLCGPTSRRKSPLPKRISPLIIRRRRKPAPKKTTRDAPKTASCAPPPSVPRISAFRWPTRWRGSCARPQAAKTKPWL